MLFLLVFPLPLLCFLLLIGTVLGLVGGAPVFGKESIFSKGPSGKTLACTFVFLSSVPVCSGVTHSIVY